MSEGGASHRIPNQANGYWRKKSVRTLPSGTRNRVNVRDPSAPTKSHSRVCCSPSWVKLTVGWSVRQP